jgi:hypothetical protein
VTGTAICATAGHTNHAREFPGLEHGGSGDVGPANRGGKPEIVALAIRSFFQYYEAPPAR